MLFEFFGSVVVLSWLPFLAVGYDPLDALFETVSAAAIGGLSSRVAGPTLEPWLELNLRLDMLLGRLDIVAPLVVLYPATWLGRRSKE